MKDRNRGYKPDPVIFGGLHRQAVKLCCEQAGDLKRFEMECLLMAYVYERRGGFFVKSEVYRVFGDPENWANSRDRVNKVINRLCDKGYVQIDPDIGVKKYRAVVYNITMKGDVLLNVYNKTVKRLLHKFSTGKSHGMSYYERRKAE